MKNLKQKFDRIDRAIVHFMSHTGHRLERWVMGVLFAWFGLLKIFGKTSASSIIAKSIYLFDPVWVVPLLGVWEVLIGMAMIVPGAQRVAIALLLIRLPGTVVALAVHAPDCFDGSILQPTIQGQYLLKELTLLGAAMVVGGTVRGEESRE